MNILVYLEGDEQEIMLSLAFIESVRRKHLGDKIQVIIDSRLRDVLKITDWNFEVYPYDQERYPRFFDIHKFCYHCVEVFNIDVFLTNGRSLRAALMGFFFRGTLRLGFQKGLLRKLFTSSREFNPELHYTDNLFLLGKEWEEETFELSNTFPKISPLVKPALPTEVKKVFVQLKGSPEEYQWLFQSFSELTFMCLFPREEEFQKEELLAKLPSENRYYFFSDKMILPDQWRVLLSCDCAIVQEPIWVQYANFMALPCWYVGDEVIRPELQPHFHDTLIRFLSLEKVIDNFEGVAQEIAEFL